MAQRSNYRPPHRVTEAYRIASDEHDPEIVNKALNDITARYDSLLQQIYRTVDGYARLLEVHGPYHEVELGEPLSRFENILRREMNDSE